MGTEPHSDQKIKISPVTYIVAALVAALAGYFAVYVNYRLSGNDANRALEPVAEKSAPPKPAPPSGEAAEKTAGSGPYGIAGLNRGELAAFVVHKAPREVPEVKFADADNRELTLSDWKGKIVLLNLWATWCAPCRKEMPGLDALKARLGGDQFDVVAVSIDRDGLEKASQFLKKINVKSLVLYNDGTAKAAIALKAFGMPTTLLLNRAGQEIGRITGPAEWNSEDAVRLIEAVIAKTS